jgi:hypothetical protein
MPDVISRRAFEVEGAEHARLRRAFGLAVVDGVDEHRHAKRVRQQDILLPPVVARLPGTGEKLDGGHPLVRRRLHFADELMQVPHERLHHGPQPSVLAVRQLGQHGRGQLLFGGTAHGARVWRFASSGAGGMGVGAAQTGKRYVNRAWMLDR